MNRLFILYKSVLIGPVNPIFSKLSPILLGSVKICILISLSVDSLSSKSKASKILH